MSELHEANKMLPLPFLRRLSLTSLRESFLRCDPMARMHESWLNSSVSTPVVRCIKVFIGVTALEPAPGPNGDA